MTDRCGGLAGETDPFDALTRMQQAAGEAGSPTAAVTAVLSHLGRLWQADRAYALRVTDEPAMRLDIEAYVGATPQDVAVEALELSRLAPLTRQTREPVTLFAGDGSDDGEALLQLGIRSLASMFICPDHDFARIVMLQHRASRCDYAGTLPLLKAVCKSLEQTLTRHATVERLRLSEGRYRTLFENAPEAIVMFNAATGLFAEVNPRAESLFSLSREALLKTGPAQLSPAMQPCGTPSRELAGRYIRQALNGGFPRFEWVHCDANGKPLECEVALARVPETPWVRGTVISIAGRKAAEREREELQQKLAQAHKLEAVGQLTGGIAHDFNNLLTVVLGCVELLRDDADNPTEVRNQATQIEAAAERARSLTHRLLAFARRQPLRPEVIDVGEMVRGMEDLLRRTLGEDVEIWLDVDDPPWPCEADPTQLENALLNLALNARDAMPQGGKMTIDVSNVSLGEEYAEQNPEAAAGDYVLMAVTDSGVGIPAPLIDDIFAPFFTTKGPGKGSGLGLSMVFGFVKQSGGHIKVYSEVGQGTSMKLYLPRTETRPSAPALKTEALSVARGAGEHILVVEDDDQVRTLTVKQLRQLGYGVADARTVEEALRHLRTHRDIDLLLTDVILAGGGSGPTLAKQAQALIPRLRVLYMSGYTENAIVHNGRLDEGVRLLEKPFQRNALAKQVRSALDDA